MMSEAILAGLGSRIDDIENRLNTLSEALEHPRIKGSASFPSILGPSIKLETYHNSSSLAEWDADALDLRFLSFTHVWNCNPFKYCESNYSACVFVINKHTGVKQHWAAIETSVALQSGSTPIDWGHKGEWYRYYQNVSDVCAYTGNKEGRDPEIWGLAKFYDGLGNQVAWRWFTQA